MSIEGLPLEELEKNDEFKKMKEAITQMDDKCRELLMYVADNRSESEIQKILDINSSKIIFEPGRFIIGNTAILITKVLYIKENTKKDFIILDAAMNDLIRPALYGAQHKIISVNKTTQITNKVYEFVGPICESTDKFLTVKRFQKLNEKSFVVICDVGAYGISLASNYNIRPKPIEILIKNSKIQVIKKRQKLSELI